MNDVRYQLDAEPSDTAGTPTPSVLIVSGSSGFNPQMLATHLDAQGYLVKIVDRLPEYLPVMKTNDCSFLVLDLESATELPLVVTARTPWRIVLIPAGSPKDAVRALTELGAVALLELPPHPDVLVATLDSLCQRFGCQSRRTRERVRAGEESNFWHLLSKRWSLVSPAGRMVGLSYAETNFLLALAKFPGEAVLRRDLIVALGHKPDYYDSRRLDTFASRLRQKVATGCGTQLPLRSIHAYGYAFASPILAED